MISSATTSTAFHADGARQLGGAIATAPTRRISAATLLELGILTESRRGRHGAAALDEFMLRSRVEVVSFDAEQAEIARDAFRRYGRGRHAAGLNFGDCFAYALAKFSGESLLFKGDDFARTDVDRA
jgi:ribonuclease VapC